MINISIQAASPEELIQTLAKLALGTSTMIAAPEAPAVPAQEAAVEAKPARTRAAPKKEEPAAEVELAKTAAPVEEPQPTTLNGAGTAVPGELDFDRDAAPKVLGYIRHKGKPWVEEILNEFGVRRASEIMFEKGVEIEGGQERMRELLDTLADRGGPLP